MEVSRQLTSPASRVDRVERLPQRGGGLPVFFLVAPCEPGVSPVLVQRGTCTTGS
jgi:hypothetical protein